MKKTDIAMIILIAGISVFVSYLTLNSILGDPSEKTRSVQVMEPISKEFIPPSKYIFYKGAINPTVQVTIGVDEKKKE